MMNFFLSKSNFSINEVEYWLLKYSDKYNETQNICECDSKENDLPCICKISMKEENRFILDTYCDLEELCEYHKFENYAEVQLLAYQKIKGDREKIKQWLIKNEKIGCDKLACFLIDYLDYAEKGESNINLLVCRNRKNRFFVNREHFKNLIEFKELFDELYYIKKMYPEGLKRIEEQISKLPEIK